MPIQEIREMFEKWCTPWRERKKYIQQQSTKNRETEEGVSLTTTPELADDNIDEEGATLDEKISKVLRFDETDEDGRPANHPLVETPMTCDSVQSSSAPVAKQKEGEEKDGGGDEAESAPTTTTTTTTTGSFGTSFKEWMSTARKSWEFKRKSSSRRLKSPAAAAAAAAAAPRLLLHRARNTTKITMPSSKNRPRAMLRRSTRAWKSSSETPKRRTTLFESFKSASKRSKNDCCFPQSSACYLYYIKAY